MATPEPAPDAATDPRARGTARQAIALVLLTGVLLVLFAGDSVSRKGRELDRGVVRSVVLGVGGPAGAIADALPFAPVADELTGWVSADDDLGAGDGGFQAEAGGARAGGGAVARIPESAFATERAPLRSLLVTGDSMAQPLDAILARDTAEAGIRTVRDAKIGTGISKTDIVDWSRVPAQQLREAPADAVVVFLGANEGFPMPVGGKDVACCSPAWAAEYATRVRAVIDAYRAGGAKRVYWLTVPAPRDPDRAGITATVNRAVDVAAGGFGATVQRFDAAGLISPGFRYRDAMAVDGRERLVRDPDGIHLNDRGSELVADGLMERLRRDFVVPGA